MSEAEMQAQIDAAPGAGLELPPPGYVFAQEIETRFSYHAPRGTQPARYELLRAKFRALAHEVVALTPASREQSEALTCLETGLMFANAAIARRE